MRVVDGISLGYSLLLLVGTVNSVQTLKASSTQGQAKSKTTVGKQPRRSSSPASGAASATTPHPSHVNIDAHHSSSPGTPTTPPYSNDVQRGSGSAAPNHWEESTPQKKDSAGPSRGELLSKVNELEAEVARLEAQNAV